MNDIVSNLDSRNIDLINSVYNRIHAQQTYHVQGSKIGFYIYFIMIILTTISLSYYIYRQEYQVPHEPDNKKKVSFYDDSVQKHDKNPDNVPLKEEYADNELPDIKEDHSISSELSDFEY